MKKKLIGWSVLVLVTGIATACYVAVPGVKPFVDRTLGRLGMGMADEKGTTWCPMHPEIVRKGPGTCPVCNMALVPLEGEVKSGGAEVLDLSDRQVQQAGVRFGFVAKRDLVKEIHAFGEIVTDERRMSLVTSWVPGRIERLHVNFSGAQVRKGELLAEIYSPPLVVAIGQFREAKLGLAELLKGRPHATAVKQANGLVESTRVLLLRQGLQSDQVKKIESEMDAGKDPLAGDHVPAIPIRAKRSGVVMEKRVDEGEYVKEGTELFRIADLSALWIYAEAYEYELPFVKVGMDVVLKTRSLPGETFEGKVAFIDPFLQKKTRTVRVRVDVPNPAGRLKPGMFARVVLRSEIHGVPSVPESAVLHSGLRKIVLVHEGKGRFRPTRVRLGRTWLYPARPDAARTGAPDFTLDEHERYHEVLGGLREGDEVVVSGAFLLSAEAQFQGLLKGLMEDEPKSETRIEEISPAGHSSQAWLREYQAMMNRVMEVYYVAGDGLADDKTVSEAFSRMEREAVLSNEDKAADTAALKRVKSIRESAARGKETKDLVEQRRAYGEISNELVAYVKARAPQSVSNGQVHGYTCGMAGKMHKIPSEDWLQPKKGLRNPYMGRAMYG